MKSNGETCSRVGCWEKGARGVGIRKRGVGLRKEVAGKWKGGEVGRDMMKEKNISSSPRLPMSVITQTGKVTSMMFYIQPVYKNN